MIVSEARAIGPVDFPEFTGERIYMVPFTQRGGLPHALSRWQRTVDQMLDGIRTDREIFLMVDQGIVEAGRAHRRPGVHIEGNWYADQGRHGGHRGRRGVDDWSTFDPEAVILASDVQGCMAYLGCFEGESKARGDCAHIDISGARRLAMAPYTAYAGSVTTLHESLPIPMATRRTLVRLNAPL
jgi:hypothetical protein